MPTQFAGLEGWAGLTLALVALAISLVSLLESDTAVNLATTPAITPVRNPSDQRFSLRHTNSLANIADSWLTSIGPKLNYQIVFGNAFSSEETHMVFGSQADGSRLSTDNYIIWEAFSLLLGALTFAKALEEGKMEIDDPIKKYLPDFAHNRLRVVNDHADGTERCLEDITVRHLLEMRGGFSSATWHLGPLNRSSYAFNPKTNYLLETYQMPGFFAGPITSNSIVDIDTSMRHLQDVPLVNQPGNKSLYGVDYDVLGAVLSAALQSDGISAAQYTKLKLLDPLNMTRTWMSLGQLQPPVDAESKMADISIHRTDTHGVIDSQAQPYVGSRVWLKEVPGDSYNTLLATYYMDQDQNIMYSGQFGHSAAGPLTDFSKLLKLMARSGEYDGQQIVSQQAMRFIQMPSTHRDVDPLFRLDQELFLAPSQSWSYGGAKWNPEGVFGDVPFPASSSTFYWSNFLLGEWLVDIETGNYVVHAAQTPRSANADLVLPDVYDLLRVVGSAL